MSKSSFEVREECALYFEEIAEDFEQGNWPIDPLMYARMLRKENCEESGGHSRPFRDAFNQLEGTPRCRYCKTELNWARASEVVA